MEPPERPDDSVRKFLLTIASDGIASTGTSLRNLCQIKQWWEEKRMAWSVSWWRNCMLAPPGGFARLGTRSTVTTCDEYPQPFVVLVVMVLILLCFSYKMWLFTSRLHIMFLDAIDHWMFWQCPNLSVFRQIWRKNQQSPVIYSVSIWHDLHTYIDRHEVYIHIYIYIYHIHQK